MNLQSATKELFEVMNELNVLKQRENDLKNDIETYMEENKLSNVDNEYFKISHIEASYRNKFNTSEFKATHKKLYDEYVMPVYVSEMYKFYSKKEKEGKK